MKELQLNEIENINGGGFMGDLSIIAGKAYHGLKDSSTSEAIGGGAGAVIGGVIDPIGGEVAGAEIGADIGSLVGAAWGSTH